MPKRDNVWVYDIRLKEVDTTKVVNRLNADGVAARLAFKPMSQQQEYRGDYKHLNAYRLSREVIYLPVSPDMQIDDVRANVRKLEEVVKT